MSVFAKVQDGCVIDVIVADQEHINGLEGQWIETSETSAFRGRYAGIGYTYDAEHDVFYPAQIYSSWTISAPDWIWTPPIPMPNDDKYYIWDEKTTSWVEINKGA